MKTSEPVPGRVTSRAFLLPHPITLLEVNLGLDTTCRTFKNSLIMISGYFIFSIAGISLLFVLILIRNVEL